MLRLLFWIALIAAAVWFWRKFKGQASTPRPLPNEKRRPWSVVPIAAFTCPVTAR